MKHRPFHYQQRQEARIERRLQQFELQSSRFVLWRLMTSMLGIGLIWIGFSQDAPLLGWGFLVLSCSTLAGLALLHRRLRRGIQRHEIWHRIKRTHRARFEMEWDAIPPATEVEIPPNHPFAEDLDILGVRSLHRFLDCSLSDGGSQELARLLWAEKPHLKRVMERQKIVRELRELPAFRNRLALEGALIGTGEERWNMNTLKSWLDQSQSGFLSGVILVSWLFCTLNWGLFAVYLTGEGPPLWILSTTAYLALQFFWQGRVGSSFKTALSLEQTIRQVSSIFSYLEDYNLQSAPALHKLCQVFNDPERRPSHQIKRLQGWVAALSVRGFPPAWLACNLLLPWDLLALSQLEEVRRQIRDQLVVWLDSWFRLESLTSLATFADINQNYVFPTIEEASGHRLRAQGMGHPLIPRAQRVVNDFELHSPGQVVIITGSNMSGKSTFLRTVGINARLAYAGAPVCATQFEISILRIHAVIRVDDSLSEGYSLFFHEVRRLRALLDDLKAHSQPTLLYLIDEIFRGTNNRERLIGSRSYIRALCSLPCIGILTTHDLDLVELEKESDRISNSHFREHIESGTMKFDYKLHDGPCPTTNALEIMRLEGLPVEDYS